MLLNIMGRFLLIKNKRVGILLWTLRVCFVCNTMVLCSFVSSVELHTDQRCSTVASYDFIRPDISQTHSK